MATRRPSGDEGVLLTVEVLREIHHELGGLRRDVRDDIGAVRDEVEGFRRDMNDEIGALRGEVGGLRGEVGDLREEVGGLREEVHDIREDLRTLEEATIRGFTGVRRALDEVNARLDNLRDVAGAGWRDHEARLGSLERRVGDIESRER